eukprot:TRINITY_DN844_c0_g1_i3.p1 TRINITY_DN844_c0_g1~~TRINITY_DN844_c0_g1_i3.p1  ORF type:complete len:499 (+),score=101.15 TRINITY_DN844_c0_g1_i3:167-1663(+)
MKTWQKVAIGVGAAALLSGVGYGIYKAMQPKDKAVWEKAVKPPKKKVRTKEVGKDWESTSGEEEETSLIQIMDEILVECMNPFAEFSSKVKTKSEEEKKGVVEQLQTESEEEKKRVMEQLKLDIKEVVSSVEKAVCKRKGWNVEEYIQEVKALEDENDAEVIKRIDTLDGLIEKVLAGKELSIVFSFDRKLNKSLTLSLYKWILCSYLYLHHRGIHNYLEIHEDITSDELTKLTENLEPENVKRRYSFFLLQWYRNALVKKVGVKKQPGEDYWITIQKAFYTYKSRDEEFKSQVTKVLELHSILQKLVYSKVRIPEFEKDPYDMELEEVEKFYEEMMNKYENMGRAALKPEEEAKVEPAVEEKPFISKPEAEKEEKPAVAVAAPEKEKKPSAETSAEEEKKPLVEETPEKKEKPVVKISLESPPKAQPSPRGAAKLGGSPAKKEPVSPSKESKAEDKKTGRGLKKSRSKNQRVGYQHPFYICMTQVLLYQHYLYHNVL